MSNIIDDALMHGRTMRVMALKHALNMAKIELKYSGDLENFIKYMERKVKTEQAELDAIELEYIPSEDTLGTTDGVDYTIKPRP